MSDKNNLREELTQLFSLALTGDAKSYALFLKKISPLLRGFVSKKIPIYDVEDVVQEILISIHKARHTFDGERPVLPWLFAIAQFRVNDALRKVYAQPPMQSTSHEEHQITEVLDVQAHQQYELIQSLESHQYFAHDDNFSLDDLLEKVSPRDRTILSMLYIEEYTAKETSGHLEMKESAVKVAAHRAIKKIKEWLKS